MKSSFHSTALFWIPLLLFFIHLSRCVSTSSKATSGANKHQFTLIQRDSEESPWNRTWKSDSERMKTYLERDRIRAQYLSHRINPKRKVGKDMDIIIKNRIQPYGEYLLKIYISDQDISQLLIYDTGSDLNWVQCANCNPCFNQPSQRYSITKSKSAKIMSCSKCAYNDISTYCSKSKCMFSYNYEDNTKLSGLMATETFSFDDENYYEDILFGCATSSNSEDEPDGLAGFALGPSSLPSQLSAYNGRNAFSSCLVLNSLNKDNSLVLGSSAVSPSGISYTPILSPGGKPDFFYLGVTRVTVGGKVVNIPSKAWNFDSSRDESGTIIDSGSNYISLVKSALNPINQAIVSFVGSKMKRITDADFYPCFRLSVSDPSKLSNFFPVMEFTFKNNVVVKLLGYHYMTIMSSNLVCGIFGETQGVNILGSYFQQNFLVVHDVDKLRVGFKPMNCATGKPR